MWLSLPAKSLTRGLESQPPAPSQPRRTLSPDVAELHRALEHPTHAAEAMEKIRALIDEIVPTAGGARNPGHGSLDHREPRWSPGSRWSVPHTGARISPKASRRVPRHRNSRFLLLRHAARCKVSYR